MYSKDSEGYNCMLAVFDCCIIVATAESLIAESGAWCDLSWRSASSTLSPHTVSRDERYDQAAEDNIKRLVAGVLQTADYLYQSLMLDLADDPWLEADQAGNWPG